MTIRSNPSLLLIGTNGGYKILERSQAADIVAVEPQRVIRDMAAAREADTGGSVGSFSLQGGSVYSLPERNRSGFDMVEISLDFLREDNNNRYGFTQEAVDSYLGMLSQHGVLSVAVDISEFTYYAIKVVNTIVDGLRRLGVENPASCLIR